MSPRADEGIEDVISDNDDEE
jgi:hypothetical protein